jgi:hypothetical protein
VTISEETIMKHLHWQLGQSDPGDTMHHLVVLQAPAGATGPLGTTDETQVEVFLYGILAVPDEDITPEQLIAATIRNAGETARSAGTVVEFAALSQEAWTVRAPTAELRAWEGRLNEHPDMVEMTIVYGACRDGRRWRGRRHLTGPHAGVTEEAQLLIGPVHPGESHGVSAERLIRQLVGMPR